MRTQAGRVRSTLESEGVLGHSGNTEVGGHRTEGEDQVVVCNELAGGRAYDPLVEIDVGYCFPPGPGVALPMEDAPGGVADVVDVEAGRSHLVQQRLEGVMIPLVDDGDVHGSLGQPLRHREASEACADHDDRGASTRVDHLAPPPTVDCL
jgi:hypothetical protein